MTEATSARLESAILVALQDQSTHKRIAPVCCIYVMLNRVSGKAYVGRSKDAQRRALSHVAGMRSGKANPSVQADCNEHGSDSFGFAVVHECAPEDADELEKSYIRLTAARGDCHNAVLCADPVPHAARQKALEARKTNEGLVRVAVWAHPDDAEGIREFARGLCNPK